MRRSSLALLVLVSACGPGGGDTPACKDLVAGDLVITEVMANPAGADTGKEWIEIYNASGASRDLAGVVVTASKADGTSGKSHTMRTFTLAAGDYAVLGDVLDAAKPAYVDYGYGADLGTLLNAAGRITVTCGAVEVDRATYDTESDGVARGLSGDAAPDYQQNDDPTRWCDATMEYAAGSFGSPGMANEVCPQVNPPGMCNDNGTMRATVPPATGDLVITELMPDPSAVGDDLGEWFEVFANASVDLNGLEIGKALGSPDSFVSSTDCIRVNTGDYLVFAHSTDMTMNGGLPKVDAVFPAGKPGLSNSGGALVLSVSGTLVDQVTYTGSKPGRSVSLDPGHVDATQNDDAANFCDSATTDTYGVGDHGTPGMANTACPVVVPPGMCIDAGTMMVRAIVPPAAGQVVITEFMANPAAVADSAGEWFELFATADVDLNGLEIGKTPPTVDGTLSSTSCLHVAAGGYALLAKNGDTAMNGGLPAPTAILPGGVSLVNSASGIFVAVGGTTLDAISYTTTGNGASTQLDPDMLDPTANDTVTNWCPGTQAYGAGDKGTPGAANLQCP
jgi:hypothetical protein